MCDLNEKLYHAVRLGHVDEVKKLIAAGADVNHVDEYGYLHINWTLGLFGRPNEEIVKLLLEAGMNVNHDNGHGTLIYHAANANQMEIVRLLRKYGAKFDFWTLFYCLWINPIANNVVYPLRDFLKQYWPQFGDERSWHFRFLDFFINLFFICVLCFFISAPFAGVYNSFVNMVEYFLFVIAITPFVFFFGWVWHKLTWR